MSRPALAAKRQRGDAGFTLTELMVVVAIVGVLVTLAVVYMRPRVRPIDVAARVGDLVHEASRRAVALGPVRADVVTKLGIRARTQITAQLSATQVTFSLFRLEEGALGSGDATWMPIESYAVHPNVLAVKWASKVGDKTLPTSTVWSGGSGLVIQCRPDGTCDPRTLFFEASVAGPDCMTATTPLNEQCGKLAVMPLGGAITTRADWN
jgi:prepilin-type N-terminal cleavage/methylation domain-containing protein